MDHIKIMAMLQLRARMLSIFKSEHTHLEKDEYDRAFSNANWKIYLKKAYDEASTISSWLDEINTPSIE